MQVTTHQALKTPGARLGLAQRIALAALAIFLMLDAVTLFITPDPPWLANLPWRSWRSCWPSVCRTSGRSEGATPTLSIPRTGRPAKGERAVADPLADSDLSPAAPGSSWRNA
jgi:hypothetical protein